MPGRFIVTLYILFTFARPLSADGATLSDCEALDQLLSGVIKTSISGFPHRAGEKVFLYYSSGLAMETHARNTAEAAVSAEGLVIAEREYDYRISIMISDIQCALTNRNGTINRFISMSAHIICADRNGSVIFARIFDEHYSDSISRPLLGITDTAQRFSGEIQRTITRRRPGVLKIISFGILSVALAYFSFQ